MFENIKTTKDITFKLDNTNLEFVKKDITEEKDFITEFNKYLMATGKAIGYVTVAGAIILGSMFAFTGVLNRYEYIHRSHPDNIYHEEYLKEMDVNLKKRIEENTQITEKSYDEKYLIHKYRGGENDRK